ncbi:hypothetical protein OH76DRAFT_688604 [Lentinus brumalis]|uniref:Uncharacterized protein n=1 Tax=Lentinus brumalis TaxID=2498619 RepID=A0A371D628_9APHY|nr:hypothetical protein OH76DRAFT_688604 [Polyporus brumalis]
MYDAGQGIDSDNPLLHAFRSDARSACINTKYPFLIMSESAVVLGRVGESVWLPDSLINTMSAGLWCKTVLGQQGSPFLKSASPAPWHIVNTQGQGMITVIEEGSSRSSRLWMRHSKLAFHASGDVGTMSWRRGFRSSQTDGQCSRLRSCPMVREVVNPDVVSGPDGQTGSALDYVHVQWSGRWSMPTSSANC